MPQNTDHDSTFLDRRKRPRKSTRHLPPARIIESRCNRYRALLLTASPAISFILLAPRIENETTTNAWVGVLGYSRAATWLGLPVYQNFLNFGSALPLMSSVSLSPLTPLGGLFPVQVVQIILLTVSTLLGAHVMLRTAFIQRHVSFQKTTVATILLYPLVHYFFANDWTEYVPGAHGFAILTCVLLGLSEDPVRSDISTASALWVGASLLTLTHLGYVGALLFPLLLLSAIMGLKVTSRIVRRSRTLRRTIVTLLVLVAGVWSSQILHLLGLGVTNNARPRSLRRLATELYTFGVSESFRQFEGIEPLNVIRHLPYNRSLFLLWPAILVIFWVKVLRHQNVRYAVIEEIFFRRITLAILMMALFAVSGNNVSYPLRPSDDYLYRDAIVILMALMLGVAFKPKSWRGAKQGESRILVAHYYRGRTATVMNLLFLTAGFIIGQILPLWSGGAETSAGSLTCSELPRYEVVWVSGATWEGTQPDNFFDPTECSLFQMVESDLYSVGAFLKIRQTSSDGEIRVDLQNRVGEADLRLVPPGSIDRLWLERSTGLELFRSEKELGGSTSRYFATVKRCHSSSCVLKISEIEADRNNEILWNYDPNLVAVPETELLKTSDGYIQVGAATQNGLQIRYRPPIEQKVSILAAWTLFLVAPICNFLMKVVCRMRHLKTFRSCRNFVSLRITDLSSRRDEDSVPEV